MPSYRTKLEPIAIGGAASLVIRSLLDRQQFADPLGEAQRQGISSASWPLFGLLWPSAGLLAARLAARPVRAGERILEVGCGLALASLVGHRRGADVTASDCHPLAEYFLRENLRLNGLPPMKYRHGRWGPVAVPDLPLPAAAPAGDFVATACVVTGHYDLIIGSDLLYERDPRGDLAAFIAAHAMPRAEVWIIDPDRGNRRAFHRHMAAQGFALHETRLHAAGTAGGADYRGRLLQYQR